MARKQKEEDSRSVEKRTWQDHIIDIVICLVFGLFTIICIYPFYYIFINTISDNSLVATGRISFIPRGIHLSNYVKVLSLKELPGARDRKSVV